MLRKRAVRELLAEEVAGLRSPALVRSPPADPDDGSTGDDPVTAASEEEVAAAHAEALAAARRRAGLAVAVDAIALLVLFLLRDRAAPFLPFDATVDSIFTVGALLVAAHAGFRLGQLEKYRAVARAFDRVL